MVQTEALHTYRFISMEKISHGIHYEKSTKVLSIENNLHPLPGYQGGMDLEEANLHQVSIMTQASCGFISNSFELTKYKIKW